MWCVRSFPSGHQVMAHAWALLPIDASGRLRVRPVATSSHGSFWMLEISGQHSNAGTHGGRSMTGHWGATRSVTLTGTSGHPTACAVLSPTALFRGGFYLSPIAGSSSRSWWFALTYKPCELSQSYPTHLHHWFIIFVSLRENPSALLECLHL
jgi:hypothetical protein